MAAATRAKFRVWSVKQEIVADKVERIEVTMGAVTGADGSDENKAFWKATPAGQVTLAISNPDAFDSFKSGQEYYLDFTPAWWERPPVEGTVNL